METGTLRDYFTVCFGGWGVGVVGGEGPEAGAQPSSPSVSHLAYFSG